MVHVFGAVMVCLLLSFLHNSASLFGWCSRRAFFYSNLRLLVISFSLEMYDCKICSFKCFLSRTMVFFCVVIGSNF